VLVLYDGTGGAQSEEEAKGKAKKATQIMTI